MFNKSAKITRIHILFNSYTHTMFRKVPTCTMHETFNKRFNPTALTVDVNTNSK